MKTRVFSLLLALAVLFGLGVPSLADGIPTAPSAEDAKLNGEYDQDAARGMLDLCQSQRTLPHGSPAAFPGTHPASPGHGPRRVRF